MKRRGLAVLLLLSVCFVWGNSLLPKEPSTVLSDWFTALIGDQDGTWLSYGQVRKLAHVLEFAGLGLVITLFIQPHKSPKGQRWPSVILAGMLAALADETIQLFNDRGSSVKDVWIDMAGFMVGSVLTGIFLFLWSRKKEKRGKNI